MSKPKSVSFATKEGKAMKESRQKQLEDANWVVENLLERLGTANEAVNDLDGVRNQAVAVHQEVDKQFKKSPILPVSSLTVSSVNILIKDTKDILGDDDRQLSRIKQFVTAGDNPETRDVSMVLYQLIECHKRLSKVPKNVASELVTKAREARLFKECLTHFLTTGEELGYAESRFANEDLAGWFSDDDFESFLFDDLDKEDILNYFDYDREPDAQAE